MAAIGTARDLPRARERAKLDGMCRNIRVLHHFEPPTTDEEIRAAALQYVRKVSGVQKPGQVHEALFEAAVQAIAESTRTLLRSLPARGPAKTREGELEKARAKWREREARIAKTVKG